MSPEIIREYNRDTAILFVIMIATVAAMSVPYYYHRDDWVAKIGIAGLLEAFIFSVFSEISLRWKLEKDKRNDRSF